MEAVVIVGAVLATIWVVGRLRQPRHIAGAATFAHATDPEAWRALVRPVRFTAPVAYGALVAAIRDSVGGDTSQVGAHPGLAQRALDSQTTTFVYGTRDQRFFVATVVCEPEGTGSRGRLEVSTSAAEVSDPVQHRALRQLRARLADGVARVGGHVRDL